MDRLKHLCEEWLGNNWEIVIKPNGYTVFFTYEAHNAVPVRTSFKGQHEASLIENIEAQAPGLWKTGRCV